MSEFLKGVTDSFQEYWKEIKTAPPVYWLYIPAAILAVWALTVALRGFLKKTAYPYKTIFAIHRRIAIASGILGAVFLLMITHWWATKYYNTHPVKLIHLCTFLILLIIPTWSLISLRKYYKRERMQDIAEHPKTRYQYEEIADTTRKGHTRIRLWALAVAAGYLGLLIWGNQEEKNLVSIFLDNSPSMDLPLSNGKIALANTFKNLNPGTNIVLSSFTQQTATTIDSYNDIAKSARFNIVSTSAFFNSPDEAREGINNISISGKVGSPITQAVWENYQFVQHSCPVKEYKHTMFLVITDGLDNINEPLRSTQQFLCDNGKFNDVFAAENIRIIDVGDAFDNGNNIVDSAGKNVGHIMFFEKANKCGYNIQPGKDLEDYTQAVDEALKDFKKDWWFIGWTIALYMIYLLIVAFIKPPQRS